MKILLFSDTIITGLKGRIKSWLTDYIVRCRWRKAQLDVKLLSSGLYVLHLTDKDGNISSKKWIKNSYLFKDFMEEG